MQIKLLLVDDEPDFSDMLAERLQARGLAVDKASSGEQALERVRESEMDVVVMDVQMPGKDGIESLWEIKQIMPLVEVILLTGHATVESAVRGMTMGAFDYLMKPVEMKILLEKIVKAYQRKIEHEDRIRHAEIQRILITAGGE